jgi:hypothetical protein
MTTLTSPWDGSTTSSKLVREAPCPVLALTRGARHDPEPPRRRRRDTPPSGEPVTLSSQAAIGRLEDAPALLAGRAGTTVRMSLPSQEEPPCSTRSSSASMAAKEAVTR